MILLMVWHKLIGKTWWKRKRNHYPPGIGTNYLNLSHKPEKQMKKITEDLSLTVSAYPSIRHQQEDSNLQLDI